MTEERANKAFDELVERINGPKSSCGFSGNEAYSWRQPFVYGYMAAEKENQTLRALLKEAQDSVLGDIYCSENCWSNDASKEKELLKRINAALGEK